MMKSQLYCLFGGTVYMQLWHNNKIYYVVFVSMVKGRWGSVNRRQAMKPCQWNLPALLLMSAIPTSLSVASHTEFCCIFIFYLLY